MCGEVGNTAQRQGSVHSHVVYGGVRALGEIAKGRDLVPSFLVGSLMPVWLLLFASLVPLCAHS